MSWQCWQCKGYPPSHYTYCGQCYRWAGQYGQQKYVWKNGGGKGKGSRSPPRGNAQAATEEPPKQPNAVQGAPEGGQAVRGAAQPVHDDSKNKKVFMKELKDTIAGLATALSALEASPCLPGIAKLIVVTRSQLEEAKTKLQESKPVKARLVNTVRFLEREKARLKVVTDELTEIEAKRAKLMVARTNHEFTIATQESLCESSRRLAKTTTTRPFRTMPRRASFTRS